MEVLFTARGHVVGPRRIVSSAWSEPEPLHYSMSSVFDHMPATQSLPLNEEIVKTQ